MRKYYYFILLSFLLAAPFANAALIDDLQLYYSFDNTNISSLNPQDLTPNNRDGTGTGVTTGQVGLINEDFYYDGSDYISINDTYIDTASPFTIVAWVANVTDTNSYEILWGDGATTSDAGARFEISGNSDYLAITLSSTSAGWQCAANTVGTDAYANTTDGQNHMLVGWYNGTNCGLRLDDTYTTNAAQTGTPLDAGVFYIARRASGAPLMYYDGEIDEFGYWNRTLNSSELDELYRGGLGNSYYNFTTPPSAPSTPTTGERLQQDSSIEQNATVTINSLSYAPVMSSSITITDDTYIYGSATVPISPTGSNTATCRLTIDGAELNETETSRTLTAGSAANILITSLEHFTAAGTYSIGLECLRSAGAPYTVGNASILVHILTTPAGVQLETAQLNFTSAALAGLLGSTTITTSENYTATGLNRYLVTEWAANYVYGATGNISVITELAGTNCTEVKRYGTSGSTGSVGGLCYVNVGNETNSTTYNFRVFGTGTGSVTNAKFHIKEFILHDNEINSTALTGLSGNGVIANINLTVAGGHSNPDLIGQAILSVVSTSGTQTGTFYLTADSQNSTYVSRTSNVGQPGVLGVHKDFETVTGTVALSLVGNCANCAFTGQYLLGYLSSDVAATPDAFLVTVNSTYGGSLSEFDITLSDGRSFSTTSGSISVPATGQILNITVNEDGTAAIPYFGNSTNNHNSTNDVTLFVTPYTVINATYSGTAINNFTVNGTSTTSGKVYVRLYNATQEYTISNAVSSGGVNLSDQSANVTASPYLQSYTFVMLTANAFNFSIFDEITEAAITENMTIEIISTASAGTYTTTDGTLYLELLTPADYTIRYYSTSGTNYTQRDYIQTLTDRQRYEIDLYSILNEEATDMVVTIKDTSADPVEGAIVKLLRYFTSCNCYKVVEMSTTSAAGESYFIVDAYDGHYKFAVEYNGETEFLSSSPENFIPSGGLVSRTISINLGSAYFESFRELTNIARTIVYNNNTKGLSFTWNDPSGIVTKGCLYAEYLEGVHYTAVTPVCQEASTGSVVLTLNNSANSYKYYAELETSTTYSEYVVFSGVIDKIRETLLQGNIGLGAFLGAGVMAVLALMFSFSAIAVMIVTVVGVVGMSVLGIASFTTIFVTGFATLIIGIAAYLMRS